MVEFAMNNSAHASTTHTTIYVNGLRNPRIPSMIQSDHGIRGKGLAREKTVMDLARPVSMFTPSISFDVGAENVGIEEDEAIR